MSRQILAVGSATLLLFAAMVAAIPAIAQEQNTEQREQVRPVKERPHGPITVALGFGGAVEENGSEVYRSHIRIAAVKSDAEDADFTVKRGVLDIGYNRGGHKYEVVPDTWTVNIREDNSAFSAEGKVQEREGEQYSVSLSGELLDGTKNGNLYFVNGKFSGDGEDEETYKLYYLMIVHEKTTVDKKVKTRE
jgi:hypothetical protein